MVLKETSRGEEVKKLQAKLGLETDGIYGNKTYKRVKKFQLENGLAVDGVVGSLTWEALFGEPMSEPEQPEEFLQRDCMKLFGNPHESSFYYQWIVPVKVHKWKIEAHKWMVKPLEKVVENLKKANLLSEWKTFDGCWVVRYMRGTNQLSIHSWGLAIDVNAATNPFNSPNFSMSEEFAQCWKDAGFSWGGDWEKPVDAMHFQLPRIK